MRFVLLTVTLALAAQQPTIRVPVRLVNQRVLIFSAENRLIPDLQPADFRVLDNGHAQTFTLDAEPAPVSIALAVQANYDVRAYLPFIAKAGATVEALLAGETGEIAILSYADEVRTLKPFDTSDAQTALRSLALSGKGARMRDAAEAAAKLLAARPPTRRRVLVLIGQPTDTGSETDLATLRRDIDRDDITVFTLTLPVLGKNFVSDTFSLSGVSFGERGGFRAATDLGKLVGVLSRQTSADDALTTATGGVEFHLRTQRQLEDGIAAIGVQLRSGYVLSYHPAPADPGYHAVRIESTIPGAKIFSRPGYWLAEDDPGK
jgi:VWFA-related protein